MADMISTLGIQLSCTRTLGSSVNLLSTYSEQLTTGVISQNMSDYSASDAQTLMNMNSEIAQQEGFLSVIDTISTRISVYNTALEGIESIASEAYSTFLSAGNYNPEDVGTTQTLIDQYMDQVEYYLNQQVGDRYIFSGSRYDTAPVTDLQSLVSPPTEVSPYVTTGDAVPAYDADYDSLNPTDPVPQANTKESATIDTTKTLSY
ncbi:MAG: flagellin, partial [Bdellovibrionales bacterium]